MSLTPAETRVVAALMEGLSYAEIAERLGIYQDEVADRVRRARGRLAARIAAVFTALQPEGEGP